MTATVVAAVAIAILCLNSVLSYESAESFLSDDRVPGFHIMEQVNGPQTWRTWRDGMKQKPARLELERGLTKAALREKVRAHFSLPGRPDMNTMDRFRPKFRMYTSAGRILQTPQALLDTPIVFVFAGGTFIWPGVRVGHKHIVGKGQSGHPLILRTLKLQPLVFAIDHFLTDPECDHIQKRASPHMESSPVAHIDADVGKPATNWRTSSQTFLSAHEDETLTRMRSRTSAMLRIPMAHFEDVQVLKYEKTQKYDAHHDFFDPAQYQGQQDMLAFLEGGHRNRLATVFWYMSNVTAGGETSFPMADGRPQPHDFENCDGVYKVRPQKGRVILFYSMLPSGQLDFSSLHGGCPVKEGTKWAANQWVYNKPGGTGHWAVSDEL